MTGPVEDADQKVVVDGRQVVAVLVGQLGDILDDLAAYDAQRVVDDLGKQISAASVALALAKVQNPARDPAEG